jgi:WD40 repeat protein
VHGEHARVRYARADLANRARSVLAEARAASGPTLLVLDDLDRAGAAGASELAELLHGEERLPVLGLATAKDPALAATLEPDEMFSLGPFGPEDVRAVARFYARPGDEMDAPVEALLAASGGVPERVHRAAREWARAEAARRLEGSAASAATERARLRAAEDELAGRVLDLQAVPEQGGWIEDEHEVVACPFKGLSSFDVEDADVFFGRERLVAEMVARVAGAPLMGIVGPSGSGKSSVLRAGLLASLRAGVLPGSEQWSLALLRPGEHPVRALDRASAGAAGGGRRLVAVDQFEEVFTACREESERAAFVDTLVGIARDEPALVLIAIRADFYGRCGVYPNLARLLGSNHVLVGPMRRDELRRAIELPARHARLLVEPDLVDALIADVDGEPGALPLLSTSLVELWQHRDGRCLGMSAYERVGGVRGAVARLAEGAYQRLDPDSRPVARGILLRLAGEGDGEAIVRRRVSLTELGSERDTRIAKVLAALAGDRLVTVGEGEVEVAHEALLREWPRLRGWLEEDVQGRRLHHRLGAAAREWEAGGRDSSELYRGARLASALEWVAGHQAELNEVELSFLDASRSASERAGRRLRAVLACVAALLILALIAAGVALNERGNARHQAVAAAAQRLGAQALTEDDLDRSLLLARQGVALDDSLQTRGNLLASLLKSPAATGVLHGDGDRLVGLDLSPDRRTLAFIENDGTVNFVDTRTRRRAAPATTVSGHAVACIIDALLRVDDLRYSPDGSQLAVGGCEPVVLDARSHRVLARLRTRGAGIVYALHFSPDGTTLYAALAGDAGTVIRRFDPISGRPLGHGSAVKDTYEVTLMPTRDGRRLVTSFAGGATVVRDAKTLRPLRTFPVGAKQAALSPDDRTMLAGGSDGSVRFLDLVTGRIRPGSGRHDGAVLRATFSADGRTAVTAGEDDRLIVWDVDQATALETLEGHTGMVTGLAISDDGSRLYSSSLDGNVLIWDLSGRERLGRPFTVGPLIPGVVLPRYGISSDGRVMAVAQPDGTVRILDASTLRTVSRFRALPSGPILGMDYVPGGRVLAVTGKAGLVVLIDSRDGRIVKRLPAGRGSIYAPVFSGDGRLMAAANQDFSGPTDIDPPSPRSVRLWALPSGRPIGRPLRLPTVGNVSLSPDGKTLAVTVPLHVHNAGVQIFDVRTRRRRAYLSADESVWDLARFTPDGRFLVGGSWKGWARLWSTRTWKPASRVLTGHSGAVLWDSVSPDGRTLATGSADGTVRLWDLPTQRPLGAPLPGLPNRGVVPQFSPDGAHLFAIYDTGRAYRWDVRPSTWIRHACAVAGRRLTRTEWEETLPGRDYAPAC